MVTLIAKQNTLFSKLFRVISFCNDLSFSNHCTITLFIKFIDWNPLSLRNPFLRNISLVRNYNELTGMHVLVN